MWTIAISLAPGVGNDILVDKAQLPDLSKDEFYWHQLEGLVVTAHFEGQQIRLGVVKSLLETGANDVLVVEGDAESVDREERLIPYVDAVCHQYDLAEQNDRRNLGSGVLGVPIKSGSGAEVQMNENCIDYPVPRNVCSQ